MFEATNGRPKSEDGFPKIGVYVCHCGINIAAKVEIQDVVAYAATLPFVAVAREYKFMCSDPGQDLIVRDLRDGTVNRVVVASCSPLMHEATFRRAMKSAETNPFYFQMANIREHVSWVTAEVSDATEKAKASVAAAVRRVALHEPLESKRVPVKRDVMVVGAGISGIHAALVLADSGKKVYLVEREPSIGGYMAKFDKTFPTLDCAACILTPKMTQVRSHPNIELLAYSEVESVEGFVGNFKARIRRKPRYVDASLCTGCGECATVCPVEVPSEFDEGLVDRKAIFRPFPQAIPNIFTIERKGAPPCQAGCPIHQNAQGYVTLVAKGKFKEAMDVILRENPLPSVCGRICTHPCMAACTRSQVDDPVNVPGIKRFVADQMLASGYGYSLRKPDKERPEKVAIVGSGPAGLMCAFELRQRGFQTVVFESLPVAGGMLAAGIPEFRLPRDVLDMEIGRLQEIGVDIRTGTAIGPEGITLEKLQSDFDAVFVAVGAHVERKLGIPGEDKQGVRGGIEFLRAINLPSTDAPTSTEQSLLSGQRIVVIGGGNSAIDAARTALRSGATEVCILYRRTRSEMPADPGEIDEAAEEGVRMEFLVAPIEVCGNGKVTGVKCQRMELGPLDDSGRPRPVPVPGSEFEVPCDGVISTIGQLPGLTGIAGEERLQTTRWSTIQADETTLETNLKGVFAGGDCVTGPDVVVNAMFAGKKAAETIARYIDKVDLRAEREHEGPFKPTFAVDVSGTQVKRQVELPKLEVGRRTKTAEVRVGYTEEMAVMEAKRCLDCGVCCDCQLCSTVCEAKAIDYHMKEEIREVEVGAILVTTGFKAFDARKIGRYGYGRYPDVYTSVEVERMVNASGPTSGQLRLRDGSSPRSVGIIHCVGSRDENTNRYCSKVCCMYSLKLAHLIKERTEAEVYNFYIDMRTGGKGYDEFYDKLLSEGVHFVRGRVAEVTDWATSPDEEGKLVIRAEDTLMGAVRRIPVDMVVLAVGLEPREDAQDVRRLFNISCSHEGFFLEKHPKLAPVSTFVDGVFIAGACQGPKDIPESVAQAAAAAAEAMSLIDRGSVETEPYVTYIDEMECKGCKTCIDACPFTAIWFDEAKKIAVVNEALCRGCGVCAIECPAHIPAPKQYQDRQILAEVAGALS